MFDMPVSPETTWEKHTTTYGVVELRWRGQGDDAYKCSLEGVLSKVSGYKSFQHLNTFPARGVKLARH